VRDPARDRRRTEDPNRDRPAETAEPPAAARILDLQRSAGNAAVARLLQRKDKPKQKKRKKKPPKAQEKLAPPPGGWNEQAREVAGTIRIPVTGVKAGHQNEDRQKGQTTESAAGMAIVIVPMALDVTKKVDTLLFFHGMGNLGYRQRLKGHKTRGKAGTVHDVEADRIPQQIAAAGGNVVGVLPQGTNEARFGIADPEAYVKEVLALATPDYKKQFPKTKLPGAIEPGRIIVAGHSGGGRAAFAAVQKLESSASEEKWAASAPLVLFDGINGTLELDAVAAWAERSLAVDVAILKAASKPRDLLAKRRLKLMSTYTRGGRYQALNDQGTYTDDFGNEITISKARGLRGKIEKWFQTNRVDPAYAAELKAQYIVEGPVSGGHEQTVGTGQSPETAKEKRKSAPSGMGKEPTDAGVPDYKGGGNLEKALKKVHPQPTAMLTLPPDTLDIASVHEASLDEARREDEPEPEFA
jgi:pimeloyl-ACP methyl ester carboxylesterase